MLFHMNPLISNLHAWSKNIANLPRLTLTPDQVQLVDQLYNALHW